MSVCKFFLQGTCKFGQSCKHSHQISADSGIRSYAPPKQSQSGSGVDTNTLVKSVVNDMMLVEKGGQWLLSCYAPFKEKPEYPGFSDTSMEEVRFGFYEAAKSGTVDVFKHNIQRMLQDVTMQIKALQNPTPDAVNMLKAIYDCTPSSSNTTKQSTTSTNFSFTQQNPTPINNSPFGKPPPSFSQATSANYSSHSSIFNTHHQPPNMQSVFNQPTQNHSIFNNTNPTTIGINQSVGMNPAFSMATTPSQSIFASKPFQQNQTEQNSAMSFYGNQQNSARSIFDPQNTQPTLNPIFTQVSAAQPVHNSPFHQDNTINLFNNQLSDVQTAAKFPSNPISNSGNIFDGGTSLLESKNTDPNIYSRVEELSKEDMDWFQSDNFDLQCIPELPPPYEMCFKKK